MSLEARKPKDCLWPKNFAAAKKDLLYQVRRFKPKKVVISTNVPVDANGDAFIANYQQPPQPGAALYFDYLDRQYAMCCATYDDTAANMVSLRKTLQALFTLRNEMGRHFFDSIMDKFLSQGYSSTFKILGDGHGNNNKTHRFSK